MRRTAGRLRVQIWYKDEGIILKEKRNTVQEPEMIQHEGRQEKGKTHRTQSRARGLPRCLVEPRRQKA